MFVAAPLPEPAAVHVWSTLADVRVRHPQLRWVPPEKLHLTLVFLGPVGFGAVPRVATAMKSVAQATAPFEVATGEAGGYAGGRRGGVAWLHLSRGDREIAELSLELDRAIGSATYDTKRAPRPHLTVARHVTDAALASIREAGSKIQLAWLVDRVVLFRSHPDPGGSRYEELASAAFGSPSTTTSDSGVV